MDAQTGGFITCLLVGLLVGTCGVYMLVTGNARIMHSYHYAATPPVKMPSLARWSGAGMLVCGIGCALLVPATGMPEWRACPDVRRDHAFQRVAVLVCGRRRRFA